MAPARCQWIRGVCIAGKPGSYNPCWSRLACDGVSGVPVAARSLHRGQARLLQSLLELACLRWPRRGASGYEAPASRASPAPTIPVGAGLPAMASARYQWLRGVCIAGKPGSYRLHVRRRAGPPAPVRTRSVRHASTTPTQSAINALRSGYEKTQNAPPAPRRYLQGQYAGAPVGWP